ncbi:MAG: radical SAM protein [Candidatus Nitrohelix vancouverensis]|uniref:Radical SAM protein n=1 Tax=Candidatus Nitrohelix vancouverensis TaxID=2705534 RepID=A0A7T0C557_9BACT|nr:MAG: radical SAM protein [Candidatus Nitrohelix vancouverensis]
MQIEITNRCNMDCPMCPREDLEIDLEHMEWEKFTAVLDRLTGTEDVTLTGWGEPFLHPRVFDMIALCKERGHRVSITSNALFTRPSLATEIVASGVDSLTFSIDDVNGQAELGHHNHRVLENIETVAKLRTHDKPALRLQATLHANCENDLYEVIRYAAQLGIETVNVGRLDRKYAPELKRPSASDEARVFVQADALSRSLGVQLDWLQYSVASGAMRFFYRLLRNKLHRSGKFCLKTYDYVYVTRDGNVTPCCLLPKAPMGNLLESDLKSIWKSPQFNRFRHNYRDTCGSCDLWTIAQVQDNG